MAPATAGTDRFSRSVPGDAQIESLRLPPHSVEAEQAVLGGLLLSNPAWDRIGDLISDSDFYRADHRVLWRTITKLIEDNKPADVLTVAEALKVSGEFGDVGGIAYLDQLASATPSAANIRRYAEIVRERAIMRKLAEVGTNIADSAYSPQGREARQLLDEAETKILEIGESGGRSSESFAKMSDVLAEVMSRLDELHRNPASVTGKATGFVDLDEMTTGLQDGDLIIVAGRPAMGKALALDAQIKTPNSWKRMGDLQVGDAVASIDGRPSIVVGVYPQGVRQLHRITFSDGRSTEACLEHLWRIYEGEGSSRIVSTEELITLCGRGDVWIDQVSGHFGHGEPLQHEPYRLGEELRNHTEECVLDVAVDVGLETIPRTYLEARRSARLALFQGLFAGQGCLHTSSRDLAAGAAELARSLGACARVSSDGLAHVVEVGWDRLYVRSVVPSRVVATQCIAVSHPSRLFVTNDYIVTHNTSFALNIAEHVGLELKLPVLVFSMEMGGTQLATRLLGSVGKVDAQALRTGRLTATDWDRLGHALGKLNEAPILIDESPGLNPLELRARARRKWREYGGLGLIVIDYIQLMQGTESGQQENRATELSEISRGMKSMAKELKCPVICLSQLNRSLEQRPNKRPVMSDLRESGALEQDADMIFFIYRDEVYNEDTPDKGIAEIIIGKQRNGPIGTVKLTFLGKHTRFENYSGASSGY
jgi:replicative DNA helicase